MIANCLILLALVAAAAAGVLPVGPISKVLLAEPEAPAQYEYNYSVQNSQTGDLKQQQESRSGDAVRGSYSLVQPDGVTRIVDYTSDDQQGFNADVRYEGTAIQPAVAKIAYAPAPIAKIAYAPAPIAKIAYAPAPIARVALSPAPVTKVAYSPTPITNIAYAPTPLANFAYAPSPITKIAYAPAPITKVAYATPIAKVGYTENLGRVTYSSPVISYQQ